MLIRRLTPSDLNTFQALRLAALQEAPSAFASSYEEEVAFPPSVNEDRLSEKPDQAVFGAFIDGVLVGVVALGRESMLKLRHKAFLWGMYVAPRYRGHGVARTLLVEALSFARTTKEVRQVNLGVNASNTSAVRLYESLGFKAFGREEGAMWVDGELHDELLMSLLVRRSTPTAELT